MFGWDVRLLADPLLPRVASRRPHRRSPAIATAIYGEGCIKWGGVAPTNEQHCTYVVLIDTLNSIVNW